MNRKVAVLNEQRKYKTWPIYNPSYPTLTRRFSLSIYVVLCVIWSVCVLYM